MLSRPSRRNLPASVTKALQRASPAGSDEVMPSSIQARVAFFTDLKPTDPVTLAVAALAFVTAGLTAGYLPARRASRVAPMIFLRHD